MCPPLLLPQAGAAAQKQGSNGARGRQQGPGLPGRGQVALQSVVCDVLCNLMQPKELCVQSSPTPNRSTACCVWKMVPIQDRRPAKCTSSCSAGRPVWWALPCTHPRQVFEDPSRLWVGEFDHHRTAPPQLRTFCWTTYPTPSAAPGKMAASMHASRSLSVATSRSTKAAATRFARVGQRAVRPTSRSAVVVKAGAWRAPATPRSPVQPKAPTQSGVLRPPIT